MRVSRGDSLDRFYVAKAFGCGLFIHRIHHSDPVGTYHSHPWSGLSIILGSYQECYRDDTRVRRRWFLNWVRANRHHRTIVNKPVWTIFFHLPKSNKWSILDDAGNEAVTPWEGDKGHKSYTAAIGPQRAAPKSFAAVNAEVRQTQNLIPADRMGEWADGVL